MKKLNKMTSYELYMYGMFEDWNVQYIQFDSELKPHNVGKPKPFKELYEEWSGELMRSNNIFVALITWFDLNHETHTLKICLRGRDGKLHYED